MVLGAYDVLDSIKSTLDCAVGGTSEQLSPEPNGRSFPALTKLHQRVFPTRLQVTRRTVCST